MYRHFYIIGLLSIACFATVPKVSHEQTTNESINVNGTNYVISHTIEGGKILGINLNAQSKTLTIAIQPTSNGNLVIYLPRILIDAKDNSTDKHYVVLANNHGVNFQERITADYRVLTIPFYNETNTIEIKGTQVVPEFGSVIPLILFLTLTIGVGFSLKNKLTF